MHILTAIKTLIDFDNARRASVEPDVHDAIKLGIEALKQTLFDRVGNPLLDGELLPGETEHLQTLVSQDPNQLPFMKS